MHLKSLHIKNFRVLEDFQVSKLGRVNLIVGKNNSGKSSVLEAVRIYAAHANPSLLEELAQSHDEPWLNNQDDIEAQGGLPFKAFFSGRQFPNVDGEKIEIGDGTDKNSIKIEHGFYRNERRTETDLDGDEVMRVRRKRVLKADLADLKNYLADEHVEEALFVQIREAEPAMFRFDENARLSRLRMLQLIQKSNPCSYIPTQFISQDELADEWDKIGLTEAQDAVKEALRIVSPDFEDILFVRNEEDEQRFSRVLLNSRRSRPLFRNAIVKLKGVDDPVPLNSMGDGIVRLLQLFLKLFAAKGGFLLVDEFENGLHYSVQEEVWEHVFNWADKLDIQVFATTHSWDCIESFAKVATDKEDIEGVLFRVGRSVRTSDHRKVIATVFDEEKLRNVTQADVEVR